MVLFSQWQDNRSNSFGGHEEIQYIWQPDDNVGGPRHSQGQPMQRPCRRHYRKPNVRKKCKMKDFWCLHIYRNLKVFDVRIMKPNKFPACTAAIMQLIKQILFFPLLFHKIKFVPERYHWEIYDSSVNAIRTFLPYVYITGWSIESLVYWVAGTKSNASLFRGLI